MKSLARCPRGHAFAFTDDQVDEEDGVLTCPTCMADFDPYAKPSTAAARAEESRAQRDGVGGIGLVPDGPVVAP